MAQQLSRPYAFPKARQSTRSAGEVAEHRMKAEVWLDLRTWRQGHADRERL